jgi:hypothetical protein
VMTVLAFFFVVLWIFIRRSFEQTLRLPENRERILALKHYWKGKPERAS